MKIDIICVGKMKEEFLRNAIGEYSKRLGKFCCITINEVKDEITPQNASLRETELILEKEAERIEHYISESAYVFALCVEGKQMSSEDFSVSIQDAVNKGKSHIQFIIGGSLGLAERIKKRADYKLSFSQMTFPHMLMRVILLEQIYRAFKINNNEPYHK